jgi:hypothetical protein
MDEDARRLKRLRKQAYDKWRWSRYYEENRERERERGLKNYYRLKAERQRILDSREILFEPYPDPTASEDI